MEQSDIGVYGLGVMGRNLALNIEEKGYTVSVYNRVAPTEEGVVRSFLEGEGRDKNFIGSYSARYFVQSIQKPRKVLIMVKSGTPVDYVIRELKPHLSKGDILIDGGNSHYSDTNRRVGELESKGNYFIGLGVSGGKEGARCGPSLMPGGDSRAWKSVRPILKSIAAKTGDGEPCCIWLGEEGSGHFVKMVHNGIEYGLMQLLAESYHIMKNGLDMEAEEIGNTFRSWNEGLMSSYLLEITADIFETRDSKGQRVLDYILDAAGQKGTGRWAAQTALELGVPLPLVSEAVYARSLSSFKALREEASEELPNVSTVLSRDKQQVLESVRQALFASSLIAYAEGFSLINAANKEWRWEVPLSSVAKIWQEGCIIRSALLKPIVETFLQIPKLPNLLLAPIFRQQFADVHGGWRKVIAEAVEHGIPVPGMSAALAHFDMFRSRQLPANLIQAQRDYFGAHTYERTDQHRGTFFHTEWKDSSASS